MSVYQDSLKANSGYASAFSLGHSQTKHATDQVASSNKRRRATHG